ncbi:hypothetical protein SK128_027693 [Halocaridina rubra]|uniref:Uncharacterized protein n=1 Tax=Halocaridina rubra TaxID=373956 RepID=A0AAN8ZXV0_HALRR
MLSQGYFSILPLKGGFMMYRACGGHMTMDDFRGRPGDSLSQKMKNGSLDKRMITTTHNGDV